MVVHTACWEGHWYVLLPQAVAGFYVRVLVGTDQQHNRESDKI